MNPVAMLADSSSTSESLLANEDWAIEQKLDGHRVLLRVDKGAVTAFNRSGEVKNFPAVTLAVIALLFKQVGPIVFDGELIGTTYHVFDLLEIPSGSTTDWPWHQRRALLDATFERIDRDEFRTTRWATDPAGKQEIYDACLDKEGVMFKKIDSTYKPGRRSPYWVKHKHVKTCEVVVRELNRKGKAESMSIGLLDEHGEMQDAGGCRILPRFAGQIQVGDVVEIKYLYSTEENKPYQPVLLRLRPDKRPEECGQWQLVKTNRQIA